jgi:hypothetical protein
MLSGVKKLHIERKTSSVIADWKENEVTLFTLQLTGNG